MLLQKVVARSSGEASDGGVVWVIFFGEFETVSLF